MDVTGLKEEQISNQSPTASGAAPFEDKGQLSSFSHSPSPKIASILIHPSDSGASRPRSSEGRINLPRDTLSKGHRVASGHKKRSIGAQVDKVLEKEPPLKTDPFLNFGVGDNLSYSEDPLILEDVQRALDIRARRLTQQRSPSAGVSQDSRDSTNSSLTIARKPSRSSSPTNVPGPRPSGHLPFQYPSKIFFPSSRHASSISLQSNSSEELPSKSPVPVLFSLPDGTSFLDWSGASTLATPQSKDKSTIKRRTFSLSKPKAKPGEFSRNGGSLGLRTSQKDLHVALLDNFRRVAKRDTLLKAEKIKEELARRYSFLGHRKSTGVNPLVVLRARQNDSPAPPFWYSWQATPPLRVSRWTLTASIIDEYLRSIGMSFPQSDSNRSRSPPPRFSPLSSPRPSFSSSPSNHNWKEAKLMDFNLSLSTSMTEVVNSSRPILSLDPNPLPMSSRTSLQAPSSSVAESISTALAPTGQSEGTQREKSPTKTEGNQSLGRRLRVSLSGLAKDSTNFSTLSSKYTHIKGSFSTGGQRRALQNSPDNFKKSGDEAISPSSISDGGDSVANINFMTRELNRFSQKATSLKVPVDTHKFRFDDRSKALNTSESETGATSFHPYKSQHGVRVFQGSLSAGEGHSKTLGVPAWHPRDSIRYGQISDVKDLRQEFQTLPKLEEEVQTREVYRRREQLLIEANEHNRKIARLLKGVCNSLKEYQRMQSRFADAGDTDYSPLPHDVVEAIQSDPASTLRHGKGWKAVEHSYDIFHRHQATLSSYISKLPSGPSPIKSSRLKSSIETAKYLWENLHKACEQIESRVAVVEPALSRAMEHIESVQKEYNSVQMLTETDYPENLAISDLETYIFESQVPRGWLEFAAIWVPVHVLEVIGGFIRFFGVPMSEKFIRPFLWYFFRDQYYWKVYSTEPPPNERTWYTRLAYWLVIISILAWYVTPRPKPMDISM